MTLGTWRPWNHRVALGAIRVPARFVWKCTLRISRLKGDSMTRIEFWSAVMGLLVAMVVMFNQMNGRIDRLQADTNARFDQMFDRMDRMQAENNRRFEALLEGVR